MMSGRVWNGLNGIGRSLGYPTPQIPPEALKACGGAIKVLQQGSSVEEYAQVEAKLAADDQVPSEKVKGYLQREFANFLNDYDKKQDWGGLSRIVLGEGVSVWCCEECCKTIEENPGVCFRDLRQLVGNPLVEPEAPVSVAPPTPPAAAATATATGAAEEPEEKSSLSAAPSASGSDGMMQILLQMQAKT